ncbi:MAG: NYN domain-containing protein [Bacteroidetes bacterium]|nr:NYN domain-containing protein [Bacteroidota bacterium]
MAHKNSVAILIDGGFFLKRYRRVFKNASNHTPAQVANNLYNMARSHLKENDYLYRIFYYDSTPLLKRVHNPISKKVVDFSKTPQAKFRLEFFEEMKKKRKVALRLGFIKDYGNWLINHDRAKELLSGKISISDLTADDVTYEMRQKGIDIKIGVDIASLSLKKFVTQIILISGDSDFVPASKLARREGIDFILDPMWNPIDDSLFEHIDGLQSKCGRPFAKQKKTDPPTV